MAPAAADTSRLVFFIPEFCQNTAKASTLFYPYKKYYGLCHAGKDRFAHFYKSCARAHIRDLGLFSSQFHFFVFFARPGNVVAKCPIGLIQHVSTFEIFCAIAKKRDNHHKIRITRKPEFSRAPRALEKLPYLPLWKFNIKFFAHLRENIYAQASRRGAYRKFFCVHAGITFDKKM